LVCTDKPYSATDLKTNEIGSKDEFDCLVEIKDNRFYNINVNISNIRSDVLTKKLMNMKIGNNLIFYNVDLDSTTPIKKSFIIKSENGKVYDTNQKPVFYSLFVVLHFH